MTSATQVPTLAKNIPRVPSSPAVLVSFPSSIFLHTSSSITIASPTTSPMS